MNKRSPLAIIFFTVFIDLVGFGIVIPILPLYAQYFGASPFVIGCLVGIYSLMQFIAAPLLGKLSDRLGRRPVLLVSILGTAFGFLLMGWAKSLEVLFLARIIDGITGGNLSTAQAYIADVTTKEDRSKGMGLIGAAFGLGFIFGPAIGGVLSGISLAAPFYFAAALALCNAVALFFFLPESLSVENRHPKHARAPVFEVFQAAEGRSLVLVMATYFFTTVAFSLLTATYSLFTNHRFGLDARHNGYLFAGQGLLGALMQGVLLRKLVTVVSDKRVAFFGALLLSLGLFLLPLSRSMIMLFAVTAALGIGHGCVAAPLNGIASKKAHGSTQGRVIGLMQSSASLARIAGPVVGGLLLHYDASHLAANYGQTPYWAAGILSCVALVLTLFL